MTYAEKLRDPRWQKKRLQILERDQWKCLSCFNEKETLHVHHMVYEKGIDSPWESDDRALITVCETCHDILHGDDEQQAVKIFIRLWFLIWLRNKNENPEFDCNAE